MAFWAYILRCADGSCYTGHTDNLPKRLNEHTAGGHDGYTAQRRPVQLVWSQEFVTRAEALESELRIKRWSRKKKEALIAGDWGALQRAAKKDFRKTVRHPADAGHR